MWKKIAAIILSLALLGSLATVAAFAAPPEKSPVIYFDANSVDWEEFSQIYCHIFIYGEDPFYQWQTIKEKCTDKDKNGVWTYDLEENGISLEDGQMYCVQFSSNNNDQTYHLLMDTSCYEDTAYANGESVECYVCPDYPDSTLVYWTASDPGVYGPMVAITSTGNVIGEAFLPAVTPSDLLRSRLSDTVWLENVESGTGMTDQELVDHLKEGLSMTDDEVYAVVHSLTNPIDWTPSSPATPDQPTVAPTSPPTEPPTQAPTLPPSTGILGDVDCDGVVTIIDASLIQKYKAHVIDETKIDLSVADVDSDGVVSVLDATRIQRYKAGLCNLDGYLTRSENSLYFDPATAGLDWKNSDYIGFHIVRSDGEALTELGSEEEKAEKNPDGTYRMDNEEIAGGLEDDEQYIITFYNDKGDTTHELIFDKRCLGDVAKCPGETILDKPTALWKDQDRKVCGPRLIISPTGSVLGDCLVKGQTAYTVLYDFFKTQYSDVLPRSGKTSQNLIDDIAQKVGIRYQYEISVAILESGVNVSWRASNCPLPVRASS